MIGKEIKYRFKKARMPSARIKCTANMAHSCTSIQSCMKLTRGPSCFMTWRASVHPFARSAVRKKTNRKYVSTKIPEGRKKNSSPTKGGKEKMLSASHLIKNQLQEAAEKFSIYLKKCNSPSVLTQCQELFGYQSFYEEFQLS